MIGKFNSAEELLKGYESLEKSFTQKCQQLSVLEKKMFNDCGTNGSPSPQNEAEQSVANDTVVSVPEARNADELQPHTESSATLSVDVIRQYLAEHPAVGAELIKDNGLLSETVERTSPPRVMTSGGNVSLALPNRPKTLKEASDLAKKYFQ